MPHPYTPIYTFLDQYKMTTIYINGRYNPAKNPAELSPESIVAVTELLGGRCTDPAIAVYGGTGKSNFKDNIRMIKQYSSVVI